MIDCDLKDNQVDSIYIGDFIFRARKNCDVQVLKVDDSMLSISVIKRELKLQRFEVWQATNSLEAMSILKPPRIKLVLVDSETPNMDGYTFIKKHEPYIVRMP